MYSGLLTKFSTEELLKNILHSASAHRDKSPKHYCKVHLRADLIEIESFAREVLRRINDYRRKHGPKQNVELSRTHHRYLGAPPRGIPEEDAKSTTPG